MVNTVQEIAYHRNGVSGKGFYAIRFTADMEGNDNPIWGAITPSRPNLNWFAALTDDPGECYVICLDLIPEVGVKFAGGNSWRGDRFEPELRAAVAAQGDATSGCIRMGPFSVPTE